MTRGQLTDQSLNSLFIKTTIICETMEFFLNVFIEFSEFNDKSLH